MKEKILNGRSLEAVERERERESYSLFNMEFIYSTTHTSNFIENIKGGKAFINSE